jgi:ubiquitin-like modifier-activating enzyme ATG7
MIRLNEAPIDFMASYGVDGRLSCRESGLERGFNMVNEQVPIKAQLIGYNTLETFQKVDKNQILNNTFVPAFLSGATDCLTSALLLTFADLKAHKILYWFAVPALMTKSGCSIQAVKQELSKDVWNDAERLSLSTSWIDLSKQIGTYPAFFIVHDNACLAFSKETYANIQNKSTVFFAFLDPSASTATQHEQPMGWPMRNLVAYICFHLQLGGKNVKILTFRPTRLARFNEETNSTSEHFTFDQSMVLHVCVPKEEDYGNKQNAVGWELNARNKAGPRWVNLAPLLDSRHLAIQAADLNLKLMKWRMLPNLNVEELHNTKVLILGAGTLGCNVARVLLGWGIRNFKIVDYGKVTYSNPVRQSLFTLQDCDDGGKPKATAAAEALKTIAADVNSEGFILSIPMPGHPDDKSNIQNSVEQLDKFVQESDVVFLLTDTRESRWLPTVMATVHDKMLINAALGLDSWLVMRHGGGLGCYFCSDVVAPENSMRNRTLDQQCTVTRPGLAQIASSMAVELMVSLLHHSKRHYAPAPARSNSNFTPTLCDDDEKTSPLGLMPHQIRGSLVSYTMMTPTIPAFSCCTGCSPKIVEAYEVDKLELMVQVSQTQDGTMLENISGMSEFKEAAMSMLETMEEDIWNDE